ncbi:MAG: hypothetical protein JXB50_02195 [Spirochaetes bacterium]|nr:hypothetical protein [Spirochaetota bacterium]
MGYLESLKGNQSPVLTKIAYDYKFPQLVGFKLFPIINHPLDAGQIAKFKNGIIVGDTRRAYGARGSRVLDKAADFVPFKIDERTLERPMDDREWKNALEPMKTKILSQTGKLKRLQNNLGLEMESKQATLATTLANFASTSRITLSGTSQFSDYTNSDPVGVIETAKEAISLATGCEPYECVIHMSYAVYKKLKLHTKLLAMLSANNIKVITLDLMVTLLGVKGITVGREKIIDQEGATVTLWGKDLVVAYVPENIQSLDDPSFGATIRQDGYPIVDSYRDEAATSDIVRYRDALEPVIISNVSGYLVKDAVA